MGSKDLCLKLLPKIADEVKFILTRNPESVDRDHFLAQSVQQEYFTRV
jgi:hypothetical protein